MYTGGHDEDSGRWWREAPDADRKRSLAGGNTVGNARPGMGTTGETIGIIRVVTCEEPHAGYREYQEKLEATLRDWGEEIERIRGKAEGMGAEARRKAERQVEGLRRLQAEAAGSSST